MNDTDVLFERARDAACPHGLASPDVIRKRANRRAQARWAAGTVLTCSAMSIAAVVAWPLMAGEEPVEIAGDSSIQFGGQPTDRVGDVVVHGASLDLPAGWQVLDRPTEDEACLGPASAPRSSCPIRFVVTAAPDTALDNGLDVVRDLMEPCAADDPRLVEVTHHRLEERSTSTYTGRCTQDSPAMTAWALDNRTAYVAAADSTWREEGRAIFDTLTVPEEWPEQPSRTSFGFPTPVEGTS